MYLCSYVGCVDFAVATAVAVAAAVEFVRFFIHVFFVLLFFFFYFCHALQGYMSFVHTGFHHHLFFALT